MARTPVEFALLRGQREGRDHGGLDGSGGAGAFAPVRSAFVEEEGRAEDEGGDEEMQQDGAGEAGAEVFAGDVAVAGVGDVSGHCEFAYFCNGWVTMLMLVMPACLTASMTEAKAPKGTRSSARR